jgi:hypothetical protein
MAFTYVDPSSGDRDKVRFLVQDTDSADYHLEDAEITYLVSTWGNVYDAAIAAAEIISGQYAHKTNYSRSIGDLSISESYGASAQEFRALASRLKDQRDRLRVPIPKINAQSIVATGEKTVQTYKSDFSTGLMDNTI